MKPAYATVEALLNDRPDLARGCILLLDWATPGDDPYDVRAVRAIEPELIVARYESEGGAGSTLWHMFMRACGAPYAAMTIRGAKIDDALPPAYHCVHHAPRHRKGRPRLAPEVTCALLSRAPMSFVGAPLPEDKPW